MSVVVGGALVYDGTDAMPERRSIGIEGSSFAQPAPGAASVDLSDFTITPGLIDAHTHLGIVDMNMRFSAAVAAAKIFHVTRLTLMQGFTTVRDAGGVDGGLATAVEEGLVEGPRILPSGPLICQTGGHGDLRSPWDHHHAPGIPGLVQMSVCVDGADEMRLAAREHFRRGATQIKVCVSGGVVSISDAIEDAQFTVEELRAAVEEAEARRTYVLAHAHNNEGIRNGLEAGVRCFEHVTFLDKETAEMIRSRSAVVVPTLAVTRMMIDEWEEWGLTPEIALRMKGIEEAMSRATRIAWDAGLKVGSGSDILGASQDRRGLELTMKAAIIGPHEALQSATSINAEIIGLEDEVGRIADGLSADFVVWRTDPVADPAGFDNHDNVVAVVQRGKVRKDTLGLFAGVA